MAGTDAMKLLKWQGTDPLRGGAYKALSLGHQILIFIFTTHSEFLKIKQSISSLVVFEWPEYQSFCSL